jgi:hypothetical protein
MLRVKNPCRLASDAENGGRFDTMTPPKSDPDADAEQRR